VKAGESIAARNPNIAGSYWVKNHQRYEGLMPRKLQGLQLENAGEGLIAVKAASQLDLGSNVERYILQRLMCCRITVNQSINSITLEKEVSRQLIFRVTGLIFRFHQSQNWKADNCTSDTKF
jgi:hypothetical protein